MLLVRANHVVSIDSIIAELWNDDPPRSASTTAQTYVYQLRRLIDGEDSPESGKELLVTTAPGYLLRVDEDRIDVRQFERLAATGQTLLEQGRAAQAADVLREALSLWSGSPLANVMTGRLLEGHAAALEEQRTRVLNLRIEADLQLGRHHQLIPELRALVAQDPYNEWYHSLLVFALGSAGRRRDALEAYKYAWRVLSDDLGLQPSSELCRIQEAVLQDRSVQPPTSIPYSTESRSA